MGRFDRIPGIDDENTTRRNVLIGGGYVFAGLVVIGAIAGDSEDDTEDAESGDEEQDDGTENGGPDDGTDDGEQADDTDDEIAIAFEHEWFGPVAEEPNPETFDPETDWPTVEAWLDDAVEHLEFVLFEMDPQSVDAWDDAADTARELDDRFFQEVDLLFSRPTDDGRIADGIPAWDIELASIIDGRDEAITVALSNIMNAPSVAEEDGGLPDYWVTRTAETIGTVLVELDEHSRYDYEVPDEAQYSALLNRGTATGS